jgi:hypothetical protein
MRVPGFIKRKRQAAGEDSDLHLVVLSVDSEFYARLEQIATDCKWQITRAASLEEAEALLVAEPLPLIICEHDPDGDWRTALRRLNISPVKPCTLLASRVADDYLWQEVVRNHGYDILHKVAANDQLMRSLKFAWFWSRRSRLESSEA